MRQEVIVSFGPGQEIGIGLDGLEPLPFEEARAWLEQQFLQQGCELLRGSGKVLVRDKILSVAAAVGAAAFQDAEWARQYARATIGALGRGQVYVDLPALNVR